MRKFLIGLCFLGLSSGTVFAASLPEPVSAALKRARIPLSSVAIVVQEEHEDAPILSLNARQAMNPASTMKLLTTFASLETLGPAYRWKTEAYLNGKLENGVLQGDLVFKGYGDPKLTVEQFWMWLRELRQRGLREIRGDIVLDHSFFEGVSQDPAEFDHDPTRAYNVGTSALLLNFNALHLHLIPDGKTTIALMEPELAGYTVRNHITTSAKLNCNGEDAYKARLDGHDIVLEGSIPAACGEADDYFSLLPQDEYFFAVFSGLWQELGGTLQGRLRSGTAPADQPPFSRYVSPPLSEVIRDINKFSNNIMARQLFLTLGTAETTNDAAHVAQSAAGLLPLYTKDSNDDFSNARSPGEDPLLAGQEGGDTAGVEMPDPSQEPAGVPIPAPAGSTPKAGNLLSSKLDAALTPPVGTPLLTPVKGTPPDTRPLGGLGAGSDPPAANISRSAAAMQRWLKTQQLQFPELVLENGAGLSRTERISAAHLAELLQRATRSPFQAELEASLPILGMDGTVKKRFKDSGVAGYAHLKTGSLEGVKSLAGYVKAHSGKQWIVVFIVNHPNAASAQPAQDALIEWLQKGY
jgi:D-alanyl-D-alanine carboxypeptidase/D-alanyl-D-alanine-endopeptidase (penicillin-binding protein 4)